MNEDSLPPAPDRENSDTPQKEVGGQPVPGDRRARPDRRKQDIPVAFDRRSGRDRRQGDGGSSTTEKRRMVDPTTCEKEYSEEEMEFLTAIDAYKRANRRPFPTWSEVLEVFRALGYRKVEKPQPIPGVPLPMSQNPTEKK